MEQITHRNDEAIKIVSRARRYLINMQPSELHAVTMADHRATEILLIVATILHNEKELDRIVAGGAIR